MNSRVYLVISSIIFGIVAIFHLLRVLFDWSLVFGTWPAPMWMSWFGAVAAGILCRWACSLARRRREG